MKILAVTANTILTLLCLVSSAFGLGSGFSGISASADSAETVVSNPAGMTRLKSPCLYGDLLIAYSYDKDRTTAVNTGQGESESDSSTTLVPAFYYAQPVGERWSVGIGPDAVAGIGGGFDDDWMGRYLIQDWSLSFVGLAPAVAYRVDNRLSVGVSLPIMYSSYDLDKAVFNLVPGSADGSFELKATGWGVGVDVGILYELDEYTRFGVVYRSKVSAKDKGRPDVSDLTPQRQALLNQFGALDQEITIHTSTPQMMHAGLYHDFRNQWTCSLDLLWVDFSEWGLDDISIGDTDITLQPGDYKDLYAATVGVAYALTPSLTTRGGAFYLSPAQDNDDRRPSMRLDRIWGLGLGGEYAFKKHRSLSLDVTYADMGAGKYTVQGVPLVGAIQGEYTTNYALVFALGVKWEFESGR